MGGTIVQVSRYPIRKYPSLLNDMRKQPLPMTAMPPSPNLRRGRLSRPTQPHRHAGAMFEEGFDLRLLIR